jgi:uncharacterized protein YmfQ (DUF2313 family)
MIGEDDPLSSAAGGPTKIEQATEAVQAAAQTVRETTQSVAHAIEAARQPGAPLDVIANWTRQAPLAALALAFLSGVAVTRRWRR